MGKENRISIVSQVAIGAALLALMVLVSLAASEQAYASVQHVNAGTAKGTVAISYEKGQASVSVSWNSDKFAAPSSVELSNGKVAKVTMFEDVGIFYVDAKKAGKTTLSYVFRGKKHTVKIAVYKYRNPIKSLTVGGKQYKAKYAKKADVYLGMSREALPAGTVKVKPAKNWKLKGITFVWAAANKKIKNGGKVPSSANFMRVALVNKKTKVAQDLTLSCGM